MEPSKIVSYYADCYQADNREQRLYDFFSKKVEYRYMLEGKEELLNHEFPHISIDGEYAEKLQKKLKVYGKEKDLVYASFFVVGKAMVLGKWQEVRAPLFWYKANLIQDEYEQDFISINFSERIINYSILNIIRTKDEESDFYQKVQEQIPSGKIELNDAVAIGKLLKQYSPEMDVEELYLYPELQGEKAIKTIGKNISKELDESVGKSVFKIVPASGIGLLEKSKQTLRILNELKDLGKLNGKQEYSTALLTLLGEHQTVDTSNVSDFNLSFMIPATLSLEQQKILDSTSNHFLSLVVGPPGTGKSYSISALAIWLMTKGKSVLIASRNDQAVDVIGEKIVNQLFVKNAIVRGGSKKYMKELKSFLGDLLSGVKMNQYKHKSDWNKHHDEYKAIQKELGLVESMFKNQEKTNQERGAFLWETQHKWKPLKYIKTKWYEQQIKKEKTVWESMQMIRDLEEKRKAKTTELIASFRDFQINDVLNNLKERKSLKSFLSSLRARTGNIQEERFLSVDLESLKKVFPIWLINLTDIGKVLPLEKELFDVLIIDEATQCDIATCLPALQRAKKVVFAGDPKQLRHVSFLSYARMDGLRTKYGLPDEDRFDFRKNSILDLVSDSIEQQNQVAFLNEHFRSEPEIIRFSNEQFYQNSLRIMSKKPNNTANTDKNIQIIHCGGKREKQGFNKIEAEKVMLQLQKIVEEQKELETEKVWSIGILSPFRDQVDYFLKMIETDLSLSIIERHQIKV